MIISRFQILIWTKVIRNTMIGRKVSLVCWIFTAGIPYVGRQKKISIAIATKQKGKKKKNDVKKGYNMCHAHVFPSKWFCQQSHVNASATPRPTIDSLRFPFIRSLKKKKKNNNKTSFFQPKHTVRNCLIFVSKRRIYVIHERK